MNYHPESNEVTIDAEGLVYVQQRNRLQASWHASTGPDPHLLTLTTTLTAADEGEPRAQERAQHGGQRRRPTSLTPTLTLI